MTQKRKQNASQAIGVRRRLPHGFVPYFAERGFSQSDISHFAYGRRSHVARAKWEAMETYISDRMRDPLPPSAGMEAEVLDCLRRYARMNVPVSVKTCWEDCGTTELRHYVSRLIRKGYTITGEWYTGRTRYKLYSLQEQKK